MNLRLGLPMHSVDDFGRDPHLLSALTPLATMRWSTSVGGNGRLPAKGGALVVCNSRRFALTPLWASMALERTSGRPVRFVGRPDIAPVGALMRRVGALLDDPDEIAAALAHREVVLLPASATSRVRHAGVVPHDLVAAAVTTGVPVFPAATMSSTVSRTARVEIGPQVRPRHHRRGPLAEVELAEQVQHHIQRLLDGFGGTVTGVGPLDWLGEG